MPSEAELIAYLQEVLADVETGPMSDMGLMCAQTGEAGELELFISDTPDAWPEGSFDVPQLAHAILARYTLTPKESK